MLWCGFDVHYPEYYIGKTKQDAYLSYLQTILTGIKTCDYMNILGHYDFIAKYSPYEDRPMTLDVSKELFAEIFSYLAKNGKGIEINTSAWWDDPCWGEDVSKALPRSRRSIYNNRFRCTQKRQGRKAHK